MRKCCVVGGGGFIGSHVVRLLAAQGRRVLVVDRKRSPDGPLPDGAEYVCCDLADAARAAELLQGVGQVIDLAYTTVPVTSYEDPIHDIVSNLPTTVRLLRAAARAKARRVLLVSSGGTVYGRAREVPIREDHPTDPISPYGISKLAVEKYGLMYHRLEGMPVVIVRPGNAYGEGQRPFRGQGFVATAIGSILAGKEVVVFGRRGTVRDYLHVEDMARGIIAALDRGAPGAVYNVGSGIGRSNRDILEALRRIAAGAGLRVSVRIAPARSFDVPLNVLDSAKLSRETGWQARIPLEEGLRRTWTWMQSRWPARRRPGGAAPACASHADRRSPKAPGKGKASG